MFGLNWQARHDSLPHLSSPLMILVRRPLRVAVHARLGAIVHNSAERSINLFDRQKELVLGNSPDGTQSIDLFYGLIENTEGNDMDLSLCYHCTKNSCHN